MLNQAVMTTEEAAAIAGFRVTNSPPVRRKPFGKQLGYVANAMTNGLECSVADISLATGYSEASVSARLRDLRKAEYGANTVEKVGIAGTYYYTLTLSEAGRELLFDWLADNRA